MKHNTLLREYQNRGKNSNQANILLKLLNTQYRINTQDMSLNKYALKAFDGKSPQPFGNSQNSDYNYNTGPALKLSSPRKDFGYDQRSEAPGADSYYPAIRNNGAGLYKRIAAETPQSDLNSYLNWVPQKEKLSLTNIQKYNQKSLSN